MTWSFPGGIASVRRGDGFAALLLPHLDSAHNLARWIVRDASLAEDVVQDAIERALKYKASYDGGDARAWLMRIVRNAALDAIAAGKRRQAAHGVDAPHGMDEREEAEHVPDPGDDPEGALARKQDQAALTRALDALPVELRECIVLRDLEELSYKEIATVTGAPIGTVMSRLWRARQNLMETMAKGTMA